MRDEWWEIRITEHGIAVWSVPGRAPKAVVRDEKGRFVRDESYPPLPAGRYRRSKRSAIAVALLGLGYRTVEVARLSRLRRQSVRLVGKRDRELVEAIARRAPRLKLAEATVRIPKTPRRAA